MKLYSLFFLVFSVCLFADNSESSSIVYDVAIIGSGPAGLSAALVTAKDKRSTILFSGSHPGGPLNAITCMGNWPGSIKGKGKDVMARLFSQVEKAAATISLQTVIHCDFSKWPYHLFTDIGEEYYARTIIIATGSLPNRLGIEGEDAYYEKGIKTFVYKPDGPQFENKCVAVIGGGIDAVKKTSIIAKHAKKVYLIVRGEDLQKPRWKKRLEKFGDSVEVFYSTSATKIRGNGEALTHLEIISSDSVHRCLEIDALVLASGIAPNSQWISNQIECDSRGYILLKDRTQKTNIPGVFAAGSITDPRYRQAAISAGDGMKAGYDALEFLANLK